MSWPKFIILLFVILFIFYSTRDDIVFYSKRRNFDMGSIIERLEDIDRSIKKYSE